MFIDFKYKKIQEKNIYRKENRKKFFWVEEHKQVGFFAHFQNLDHKGFLEDTEIIFIDKADHEA